MSEEDAAWEVSLTSRSRLIGELLLLIVGAGLFLGLFEGTDEASVFCTVPLLHACFLFSFPAFGDLDLPFVLAPCLLSWSLSVFVCLGDGLFSLDMDNVVESGPGTVVFLRDWRLG